jgi:ZU5 domain
MPRLRLFRRLFTSFASLAGAFLIASCAAPDLANPTAPAAATSPAADLSNLQLTAVTWNQQLDGPLTVSQTIDQSGGTISIPQTGLTIEFPAGAVTSPVSITVTADEKYVAYKMDPTGTQFQKDVRVTQLLNTTSIFGAPLLNGLYAAYVADDGVDLSGALPVLELEPSNTVFSLLSPLLPQAEVWTIRHFSRYILASG